MKSIITALLAVSMFPTAALAIERGQQLDASVTTSAGAKTRLKAYYGKPVLMFYENPDSVKLNQVAKEELGRLAIKWNLKDKVDTVAVANLEGFNWQPALFISLVLVRGEEQRAKIPVLVDYTGELAKAPWKLEAGKSTVLVLSPTGEVLFESTGLLKGAKFDELVATLTRMLTPAGEAPPEHAAAPKPTVQDAVAVADPVAH